MASFIGHFAFVFFLRRPVPVGLLHSLPVHPTSGVSSGDPSAESCKQLPGCWCSPSPICHSRSSNRCIALTRARRDGQLTLGSGLCKRLSVIWLGTKCGASSGLKGNQPGAAQFFNSNEQSDLDGRWAIEPDFPEIDPSLLAPSSWQLLKRGRYTYKEPIHLKARATHFNARRAARSCMTRRRVVLMLCDNMGVVLACEKGRCTDPVLLRILRRLAAISLANGARFRCRWVPSELCPSDEASRW